MIKLSLDNSIANIQLIKNLSKDIYSDYPIVGIVSICQAILESGLQGQPSRLALEGNNLYGIKGTGTDGSIKLPTKEYINGKWITVEANFAKNKTLEDSLIQHKNLIIKGPRWDANHYKKVYEAKSVVEAINALAKAGYATDPQYFTKLLNIYYKYF